ncbi:MAG TPA: FHA domain-containing protein [Anaerolineae bacterium]
MNPSDTITLALGVVALLMVVAIALTLIRRRPAPPPAAPPESIALLERIGEDDGPRIYALHRPVMIIGRGEESDIRIAPEVPGALTVSRRHAQIRREDTEHVVEDLGSENGIRVNGLITHRNLLREGYRVSLGTVEFVYRQAESSGAARSVS